MPLCIQLAQPGLASLQGATYLYIHHVAPFLAAHEQDIDVALGAAKEKAKASASDWIVRLWNQLRDLLLSNAMVSRTDLRSLS